MTLIEEARKGRDAMNPMANKTPEERKAIAARSVETRRRNRAAAAQAEADQLDAASGLKAKIQELERKLASMERQEAMNRSAIALTGKALLTEREIVGASAPWKNTAGVYFLVKGDAVVYVGQSVSIFARIGQHKDKEFDAVAFVPCAPNALDRLESLYIHVLRPPMNYNSPNGAKLAPIALDVLLMTAGVARNLVRPS